ncbi:MAG: pyrimidine 5'-nucleotidase [Alphaproteobacteria bacterium]
MTTETREKTIAAPTLEHIEAWVFDLDNTLYPASCNLFGQIDERMGRFISDFLGIDRGEARRVRKDYLHAYGTTLRGLMENHGMAPDVFLDYVHDIDHSPVPESPTLKAALDGLAGPKYVYTNASLGHAESVMARLGVTHLFEDIFHIASADYVPKPEPGAYDRMVSQFGLVPQRAILADDMARNLAPAAALGMTTLWVSSHGEDARIGEPDPHIHHVAEDLADWLAAVAEARGRLD